MRTEVKLGIIIALVGIVGLIVWRVSSGPDQKTQTDIPFDLSKPQANKPSATPAQTARTSPNQPGGAPRTAPERPRPAAADPRAAPPSQPPLTTPAPRPQPEQPSAAGGAAPPSSLPPVVRQEDSSAPRVSPATPGSGVSEPEPRPTITPPSGTMGENRSTQPGVTGSLGDPARASPPLQGEPSRPAGGEPRPSGQPLTAAPGSGATPAERPPATPPIRENAAGQTPPRPATTTPPSASPARPATATPGSPPAATTGQKYVIQDGDTLAAIARDTYGDDKYWTAIQQANPGVDPNRLLVGNSLVLPAKEAVVGAGGAARPTAPAQPPRDNAARAPESGDAARPAPRRATYTVARGDSLRSIARNVLKDEGRWRELYELNKAKISNPDVLYEGVELKLPGEPAAPGASAPAGNTNRDARPPRRNP